MRRGPSSGNKDLPTADLRYRRSERLHVEVPVSGLMATARLLDRTGKPFPVPVASTMRDDADGSRWATAPNSRSRRSRREIIRLNCRPIPRERSCRSGWCLANFKVRVLLSAADVEAQRPRLERLAVGAENPFEQIHFQTVRKRSSGFANFSSSDAVRAGVLQRELGGRRHRLAALGALRFEIARSDALPFSVAGSMSREN